MHRGETEVYRQSIRKLALVVGGWSVQLSNRWTPGERETASTHRADGWVGLSGPRLDDMENLASTRIRSLERPARIELLYRLHYPGLLVNSKDY